MDFDGEVPPLQQGFLYEYGSDCQKNGHLGTPICPSNNFIRGVRDKSEVLTFIPRVGDKRVN